ncbi:MAG TPA: hypothetical protein VF100_02005 [Thermoanaerobaculia bacterium]
MLVRRRRALPFAVALFAAPLLLALAVPACGGAEEPEAASGDDEERPPLVGPVSRAEVEAHQPDWVAAEVEAAPDAAAAQALTRVEPGAEVTVFLGTWCSDSKRELARLWRGLDDAGVFSEDDLPFAIEYVAVDREKTDPAGRAAAAGVEYVPTFVVSRDGEEAGRMVEESAAGIEHDLLALLSGEATGVLSARPDLAAGAEPGDPAADEPADEPAPEPGASP